MRVRPLTLAAAGVVAVALDLRVVAVDLLPDALGWSLVAVSAARLGLARPAALAVVATLASLPDVLAPSHYQALDPITFEPIEHPQPGLAYPERLVFDQLAGVRLVLVVLAMGAGGLALWGILRTLRARATATSHAAGAQLGALSWLLLAAWIGPYLVVAGVQSATDGEFDPVWNGPLELLALAGIAVAAAIVWVFWVNHNRAWAHPEPATRALRPA